MANSALAVREDNEPERSLAFGDIEETWVAVGEPLAYASIKYVLQNETDAPVQFSADGVKVLITLYPGKSFTSDVQANKGLGGAMMRPESTQFYVRYVSAVSSGGVYISSFYGAGIIS